VIESVWSGMLGFPIARADDAFTSRGPDVVAAVHVSGDWNGSVTFQCSEPLAREVAGSMLGIAPGDLDESDVADVAGEVANMIGGNVKAMLPGDNLLSLPAVARGGAVSLEIPGAALVRLLAFRCGDEPFVVRMFAAAGTT
jgi:chemotaxis protein CheX